MRRAETIPGQIEPGPEYDDFGRVTNFYHDEFNNLILNRNPNPPRAFWSSGEPVGPPHELFKQIRYEPQAETKPKLMLAMEGAILDCGEDIHRVFNELGQQSSAG